MTNFESAQEHLHNKSRDTLVSKAAQDFSSNQKISVNTNLHFIDNGNCSAIFISIHTSIGFFKQYYERFKLLSVLNSSDGKPFPAGF